MNTLILKQKELFMYYAKSLRDIIRSNYLNIDFFEDLDEFNLHFIDMCFKQILEDQMGMLTEVELHNYTIFEDFKSQFDDAVYLDQSWRKKAS